MQHDSLTADQIIALLDLTPHPEGGFYRQTWIDTADGDARPSGTCIYFLLKQGAASHWHRVDATEIWHHYAGAPLTLSLAPSLRGPRRDHLLGPDLAGGARPQIIVPRDHWQAAATTGLWTLVGCTVCPAFRFDGFTLARPDVTIPD
ncbi:cupin domain-containing protein [Puniceibacterium confluentis]|uniref:cupin domain-containing protein n=1 Tax=Puniceibacterium confluentis TaxID=1958944 RepID=UPI001FEA5B81|nr:cupin domain-containing protein [Puniceibacterium confluentis]